MLHPAKKELDKMNKDQAQKIYNHTIFKKFQEIIGNPLLVGWLHISVHTHGCRSRCGWHSSPSIPSTKAFLVGDAEGNAEL